MSEDAKSAILEAIGKNKHTVCDRAQAISLAYAGSANADPGRIPALFVSLCHLFATGELEEPVLPNIKIQVINDSQE